MLFEKFLFVNPDGFHAEDKESTDLFDAIGNRLVKTTAAGYIDPSLIQASLFGKVFGVRLASTANVTIATPGASFDGVAAVLGDRILLKNQSTASENGIYVFDTAATPLVRSSDFDESSEIKPNDIVIPAEGTLYAEKPFMLITNSPITVGVTSLTFQLFATNIFNAARGLSFSGASGADLDVNVNDNGPGGLIINSDFVEIRWFAPGPGDPSTDSYAVKVSDLFANGTEQGANLIGVNNSAFVNTHTHTTNLQTTLAGLDQSIIGQSHTLSANVTIGDLLSISAANTVARLNTANPEEAIGVAFTTQTTGNPVRVARNGERINGALAGATAKTIYYWNGTALTTTIPTGSGAYVWKVGVAINATDLQVQYSHLKKNS